MQLRGKRMCFSVNSNANATSHRWEIHLRCALNSNPGRSCCIECKNSVLPAEASALAWQATQLEELNSQMVCPPPPPPSQMYLQQAAHSSCRREQACVCERERESERDRQTDRDRPPPSRAPAPASRLPISLLPPSSVRRNILMMSVRTASS